MFKVNNKDNRMMPLALSISNAFITQAYFLVSKDVTLHCTIFFIMEIPNKRELQTAINHSSDIDSKDFMNIYKKSTAKPYYFLVI